MPRPSALRLRKEAHFLLLATTRAKPTHERAKLPMT